jgi:hypothetical protein
MQGGTPTGMQGGHKMFTNEEVQNPCNSSSLRVQ